MGEVVAVRPHSSSATPQRSTPSPRRVDLSNMSSQEAEMIRRAFRMFDKDASGSISAREVRYALQLFGKYYSKRQVCRSERISLTLVLGKAMPEEPDPLPTGEGRAHLRAVRR